MANDIRQRATAIIIRDGKILLMHRKKWGADYYIFVGGGIEAGETPEQAVIREVKEETTLDVVKCEYMFDMDAMIPLDLKRHFRNSEVQRYFFFRIDEYTGVPELGEHERSKTTGENEYILEWIPIDVLARMENIVPQNVVGPLIQSLHGK